MLEPLLYNGSYMDVHHSVEICPLDDIVDKASNNPVSNGDSEAVDEEPLHAQTESPKFWGGSYIILTSHRTRES